MRRKQGNPLQVQKRKVRPYSPTALTNAYKKVAEEGMSVRKAAQTFNVPDSTLRDRVLGKIKVEGAVLGKTPLFSESEELKLVEHFKDIASKGYGYTRKECVAIATEFAVQLGKRTSNKPVTMKWMRGFLKRWPEMKVINLKSIDKKTAQSELDSTIDTFFKTLKQTLKDNDLFDKPHLIFNVDEIEITCEHKLSSYIASSNSCPPAVSSSKKMTLTLIGGGSASGIHIPPYFVFQGKHWSSSLLQGSSPGASGTVSVNGLSSTSIFRDYIQNHFLKFIPGRMDQKVVLILDGSKSHISAGLSEMALQHNIILVIFPARISHILQPIEVSCHGAFEEIYTSQYHRSMQDAKPAVRCYSMCETACKAYTKSFTPENFQSGFQLAGIFPFARSAVSKHLSAKEEPELDYNSESTVEGGDDNCKMSDGVDEMEENISASADADNGTE